VNLLLVLAIAGLFLANRILELHEIVIFLIGIALAKLLENLGVISGQDALAGVVIGCSCCVAIALYNAKQRRAQR